MKKIFLSLLTLFMEGMGIFFSCKKRIHAKEYAEKNKPPIAVAGPDQVITLPPDSVSLNEN